MDTPSTVAAEAPSGGAPPASSTPTAAQPAVAPGGAASPLSDGTAQPPKYEYLVEVEPAEPPEREGEPPSLGPAYRHALCAGGWPRLASGCTTSYEMWANGRAIARGNPCLGWRVPVDGGRFGPYTFLTYDQVEEQICLLSSGMAAAGLKAGDKVGVFGANSPEWMIVLQACNRMSYVCVPVYDTLGHHAVQYVIDHAGVRALFVSYDKLPEVHRLLDEPGGLPAPPPLVVHWGPRPMGHLEPPSPPPSRPPSIASGPDDDDGAAAGATAGGAGGGAGAGDASAPAASTAEAAAAPAPAPAPAAEGGVRRLSFGALLEEGRSAGPVPPVPPRPSDLSTIMYTSGTTGEPKGVQLTHRAMVATVASLTAALVHYSDESVGPGDRMLSFLPLAHVFDRASEETCLAVGASIGYWTGDVARVGDDAAELRPTVFIGVPRVYERVMATVEQRVRRLLPHRRAIFRAMYAARLALLRGGARPDATTLRLPVPVQLSQLWKRWTATRRSAAGPPQPPSGTPAVQGREALTTGGEQAAVGAGAGAGAVVVAPRTGAAAVEGQGGRAGAGWGIGLGFLDRLIFGKIRAGLGGRLRLVVSGGAPLSARVEEFMRVTMGCPVAQGYGLTETCAASFLQQPYVWGQIGSVGPPLFATEFRLRSVPEMGYLATGGGEACAGPSGELLIRGPQLFTGYHRRPDLTREAFLPDPKRRRGSGNGDGDGGGGAEGDGGEWAPDVDRDWFRTGDIAALRPDGSVAIVDRAKNMFKLSQGEYISPERLEGLYGEAPVVEQIWVYGNSLKRSLVAVVVPSRHGLMATAAAELTITPPPPEALSGLAAAPAAPPEAKCLAAAAAALPPAGPADVAGLLSPGEAAPTMAGTLCASAAFREGVLKQLQDVGRAHHLRGFELIKAVHLHPDPFSPDNGLLTPTLKLRRPALLKRFGDQVDAMYRQLGEAD
ncbi:hypothetical protein GPECTOR_30g222 [Gonium pectorale]|uniref:AMP-dependent synthetase/ligase domain-containing protein n=1 Tax=Gonium pectorale TaxID=33097 RepID=A0A150GE62_GONPE|nr:hypothetical protein GPECTOR_30g222 [Gonium pectorale]|eukprot:KXZ48126.1 hypothetical protein GPECTOR_30g222 [Gonium pectorale]